MNPFVIAGLFVLAHCLLDYPLQGDFLSKAKNHTAPIPGVPWQWALASHAAIQGGGVGIVAYIALGDPELALTLAVSEAIGHAGIDWLKCARRIGFSMDQYLHLVCKLGWLCWITTWSAT